MSQNQQLKLEIKQAIFRELDITRMTAEELANDAPLFGEEGLGLDSLDGLQLGSLIEEHFKLRLPEGDEVRTILRNVDSIADYIIARREAV
jgi:acyl carrier protein